MLRGLTGFAGVVLLILFGGLISGLISLSTVAYARSCSGGGFCSRIQEFMHEGPPCLDSHSRTKIAAFGRRISGLVVPSDTPGNDGRCIPMDEALSEVCKDIGGGAVGPSACR